MSDAPNPMAAPKRIGRPPGVTKTRRLDLRLSNAHGAKIDALSARDGVTATKLIERLIDAAK